MARVCAMAAPAFAFAAPVSRSGLDGGGRRARTACGRARPRVVMTADAVRGRGRALDARVVLVAARARVERARVELGRLDAADAAAAGGGAEDQARAAARDAPTADALEGLLDDLRSDARRLAKADGEGIGGEREAAEREIGEVEVQVVGALERRRAVEEMERREAEESPAVVMADEVESKVEKDGVKGVDVAKVKGSILEGRDVLLRRASNVGADLEGKVAQYVKDDGSVDLAKVRSNVQGTLEQFGETWDRLNGRDPTQSEATKTTAGATDAAAVVVVHRDDGKIAALRSAIGELENSLADASKAREQVLRKEDQLGKLIRAREIRAMDDNVSSVRRTLAVKVLQLETEYIFASLAEEVDRSGYEVLEQRVMIAEFGDIDERLHSLAVFVDQNEPVLIDDDEVGALASDIQDLKMRLGLDAPLYSSRVDGVMLRQAMSSSLVKAKTGFEFYWRGMKLFGGDCMYALKLFRRVFVGYTLSPREVRTLRRTGKDLLTLVPFTIILILPLTPVGHVLIFSFLQRYWPDFFPSTFSERRQGLMRRHEAYAASIQEGEEDPAGAAEAALGDKAFGNGIRGVFDRFRRASSPARAEAGDDVPVKGEPLVKTRDVVDPIAATSSDVLSSLAGDASSRPPINGAATETGRSKPRGGGGSSVVLDDLHLAD